MSHTKKKGLKRPLTAWLVIGMVMSCCPGLWTGPRDRDSLKVITVPVIHVKGTHYQAGFQLGTQLKQNLVRSVEAMKKQSNWMDIRAEAELFLEYSRKFLPEHVEEVQGAADAAGLEIEDLFPTLCEEIDPDGGYRLTKGCSDLIASDDVTSDGSVLAAHNNDTSPSVQDTVTVVHYQVEGEPEIVAVGYGDLGISVGYNSAGISLTGNQLDANDMRVGVPRLMLVRKILASHRLGEAIDAAILKHRASNYNQVITDSSGEIYSIEGSATDYAPIYAVEGFLVHTNHFTAPWMRKYEMDRHDITCSIIRYNRATRLMRNNVGKITVDKLMEFLTDHVNHPDSICRHGRSVKTTFSVVIDLTNLTMWMAPGNPCQVKHNEYRLFSSQAK